MCTWWVRYHAPSRCWRAEVENGLIPSVRAVPSRGFAEWRELAQPLLSSKPSWRAQSTPGMLLAVLCNDKLFSELWAVSSVQSVHFSLTKILWTHQVLRDMLFSCPFNQGRAVPPHPSCNCPRLCSDGCSEWTIFGFQMSGSPNASQVGSDRSFGVSEIRNHFSYREVRTEEVQLVMMSKDISLWNVNGMETCCKASLWFYLKRCAIIFSSQWILLRTVLNRPVITQWIQGIIYWIQQVWPLKQIHSWAVKPMKAVFLFSAV